MTYTKAFSETDGVYTVTFISSDDRVPNVALHFDLPAGTVYFTTTTSGKLDALALTRLQTMFSAAMTYASLVETILTDDLIPKTPEGFAVFWERLVVDREKDVNHA